MILLYKEYLQGIPGEDKKPIWLLEGSFPDEDAAKEGARELAKANHLLLTDRFGIREVPDSPLTIFKASVPDEPTVTLRKQATK